MLRFSLLACLLIWLGCDANERDADDAGASDSSDSGSPANDAAPGDADEPGNDAATQDGGTTPEDAGICTSCGACEKNIRVSSANHVSQAIDYKDPPPVGGDHNPCWTTFGVHAREVADEHWVHNLEHGAVVFLYNCKGGCEAERKQLEQLADGRKFAIVMPYAALPTRFAVVAWENRLLSDCFDTDALTAFYDAHVNRALESTTAAPPAGCP